jgi:hypothetical protein
VKYGCDHKRHKKEILDAGSQDRKVVAYTLQPKSFQNLRVAEFTMSSHEMPVRWKSPNLLAGSGQAVVAEAPEPVIVESMLASQDMPSLRYDAALPLDGPQRVNSSLVKYWKPSRQMSLREQSSGSAYCKTTGDTSFR